MIVCLAPSIMSKDHKVSIEHEHQYEQQWSMTLHKTQETAFVMHPGLKISSAATLFCLRLPPNKVSLHLGGAARHRDGILSASSLPTKDNGEEDLIHRYLDGQVKTFLYR